MRAGLGLPGGASSSPALAEAVYNPQVVIAAFALPAEDVPNAQLVLKHMGTTHPTSGRLPAEVA